MDIFIELSAIVVITTLLAAMMRLLKQPLVVGYILSGIIVGPQALNLLQSSEYIELFSKIGVAILLFIVGLNLNPETIKDTGKISLATGLGQVVFTAAIGWLIIQALGFDFRSTLYLAVALTFSSTIIILKLLSDKGDLDKLYGKIAIGFLLVQDLVAILILLVVSVLGAGAGGAIGGVLSALLAKGILATVLLYLISKYVLPRLSYYLAASAELLFLFSVAWGLGLASLFYYLGFTIEIGALIAGVTLSVSSYADEISSRLKPLRDFFIVLFFVLLGSQLAAADVSGLFWPVAVLSGFVLIGNPLIVLIIMNLLGYRTRTAFMAGLTVAQISEFSLILMALGLTLGHVSQSAVALVTLVGIITIAGSTYLILYADWLYEHCKGGLKILTWRTHPHREAQSKSGAADMIIFGYDRVGYDFVQAAKKIKARFLVVDFNPRSIAKLQAAKIPFCFGDADDIEFLEDIGVRAAKIVVSTIPDFKTNRLLVKYYRRANPTGIISVISHNIKEAQVLYQAGASYVIMPHYLGAQEAAGLIARHGWDAKHFAAVRRNHLAALERREQIA